MISWVHADFDKLISFRWFINIAVFQRYVYRQWYIDLFYFDGSYRKKPTLSITIKYTILSSYNQVYYRHLMHIFDMLYQNKEYRMNAYIPWSSRTSR